MSGEDATTRDFANGQKVFNRYTLIKTLGRGGMGVVWLARDEELERNVALKFLPELIVHDRAVLGDMKRETRRSLDLTHKNIVRIYDFVHSEQSGCISMEYVDGDTLSNLRADKPHKVFEPHDLNDWTSQLCDALDYAHNHARIIHRDLKPANLMVNTRGDLKVSDFGISRSLSDSVSMLTMEQGRSGTLVFMSPQQLDGERGSHLDDVYSFGATVYELLTSKPPFSSGNVDRQIREKIPPSMAVAPQRARDRGRTDRRDVGKGRGRLSGQRSGASSAIVRGDCAEAGDRFAQNSPGPAGGRREIEGGRRTSRLRHGAEIEPERARSAAGAAVIFIGGGCRLVFWISQTSQAGAGASAAGSGSQRRKRAAPMPWAA